jgi:hypothetical protein
MIHATSGMGTAKHRAVKRGGGKTRCRKGARVVADVLNRASEQVARVRRRQLAGEWFGSVGGLMRSK